MSQLSFSSFDDALLVRDAQGRQMPARHRWIKFLKQRARPSS